MAPRSLHAPRRILAIVAGLLIPATLAHAQAQLQEPARDLDPETQAAIDAARPGGRMRFLGAQGFLDYSTAYTPTPADQGPLPSLFTSVAPNEEPPADLLPSQSRGVRVEINFDFLNQLRDGVESRARLPLFDGKEIELVFVHSEYRSPSDFSWFGQIAGFAASDFILTRYNDSVFMTVRNYDTQKRYEVQFAGQFGTPTAGHALRKIGDIRAESKCGTCSADHPMDPNAGPNANHDQANPTPAAPPAGYGPRAVADPTNRIDIMVCCTSLARSAGFGNNESAFRAKAQACIDDMNVRLIGSGTGTIVRLVHADWDVASDYNEDTGSGGGSNDLTNITNGTGALSDVAAMRTFVRADLVALIRFFTWSDPTACPSSNCVAGIAWRPGLLSTFQNPNNTTSFSVNAMTSSLPLVGDVFAHEVGHNLGGCHDDAQGGCGSTGGVTSSSKGIVLSCNIIFCTNYWHTTMAYGPSGGCNASTLVPFYSNPNIQYDEGSVTGCGLQPIGNSTCFVANTINTTRPYVSQYRIGDSRAFAYFPFVGTGNGTRFTPFGYVRTAVANVRGTSAEADVRIYAGDYFETAANGGPVILSNPALLVREQLSPSDPPVILR